jgi:Holliday junction resolvase RusA-like endonuclease
MIELTLPYAPSINHAKQFGRLKTSKKGNLYREMVNSPETMAFYIQVMNICRREGVKSFDDATIALEVQLDIHPPSKVRSDIDNRIKICLDSLQRAGIIADDSQIARLIVQRCEIVSQGKIVVRICQI